MPEVGEALRQARAERGIEISEAEMATKIRGRYLRAMEDDRWEVLPGRAAARGFLGTYAHYLGLDEREILARYMRGPGQTGEIDRVPSEMLPQRGALPGRSRMPGAVVLIGSIAIIAAGVLALTVAGGPDDDPITSAQEVSSGGGSGGGGNGGAAGGGKKEKDGQDSEKASSGKQDGDGSSPSVVELKATGDVWVCLLSGRGKPLVEGETLTVDEKRGPFERRAFIAAFGNGAIEMKVDGEAVEVPDASDPLGFRISPDGVRALDEGKRPDCA